MVECSGGDMTAFYEIISKIDTGKYAINYMPERWHNIIREAISIQEGLGVRYYNSKKRRINDALQCMDYMLNCCNRM
ncbi:aminoglycoside adenylyltransferase domain-containing protein [Bacillus sp. PK3_68]|uniref:aminoglycoside adenylyltransferase domain-containing protein n=1 Tax=Bacillus sp. PK3_68 TaxID=2027408 RepID=UPI000E755340|nr:aminoglycoside adenylyltransferase domain-containing protein [Bacillus sp. PK3_68]RJS59208.1 hypothetical protein CJ483_03275 [Bacillus sp. PK3_68]